MNARDENQRTPLHRAARFGHSQIAAELVSAGANVDARAEDQRTPLHMAAESGHSQIVTELVSARADVNTRDKDQRTPLHWAASNGHSQIAAELVSAGADVNARDEYQWTPLHWAASNSHSQVVTELVSAGADVNARDENQRTPLHRAARFGYSQIVAELVSAGANVDARDEDQWTPLHRAAGFGHSQIVTELISAGADVNAREKNSKTPLDLAIDSKNDEVARAIEVFVEKERLAAIETEIRSRCAGDEICSQKGKIDMWQSELQKNPDSEEIARKLRAAQIVAIELECAGDAGCAQQGRLELEKADHEKEIARLENDLQKNPDSEEIARKLRAAQIVAIELECAGDADCAQQGRFELEKADHEKEIARLENDLHENPQAASETLYEIGEAYFKIGKPDLAIVYLEESLNQQDSREAYELFKKAMIAQCYDNAECLRHTEILLAQQSIRRLRGQQTSIAVSEIENRARIARDQALAEQKRLREEAERVAAKARSEAEIAQIKARSAQSAALAVRGLSAVGVAVAALDSTNDPRAVRQLHKGLEDLSDEAQESANRAAAKAEQAYAEAERKEEEILRRDRDEKLREQRRIEEEIARAEDAQLEERLQEEAKVAQKQEEAFAASQLARAQALTEQQQLLDCRINSEAGYLVSVCHKPYNVLVCYGNGNEYRFSLSPDQRFFLGENWESCSSIHPKLSELCRPCGDGAIANSR